MIDSQYSGEVREPITSQHRLNGRWAKDIKPRLTRRDLVKGLIPLNALTVIWGAPSTGKTFIVLDLAAHEALGIEYRGRKTLALPIIFLVGEGVEQFDNRICAWRNHYHQGPNCTTDLPLLVYSGALSLPNDQEELLAAIRADLRERQAGAIVIDTTNSVIAGSTSNDEDMRKFLWAVRSLMTELGCAAILIHHCGWDQTRMSGSRILQANVDCEIEIMQRQGICTVAHKKMRDDPLAPKFRFSLHTVEVGRDEDSNAVMSCVVVPFNDDTPEAKSSLIAGRPKMALDLLTKAIDEAGETLPASTNSPDNCRAVKESIWREYCHRDGLTESDKPETRQKTFVRAKNTLLERQLIDFWEEWVWPVK